MLFLVLVFSLLKRIEQTKKTVKYKTYNICEEELSQIVMRVNNYLSTNKRYLDCDYTVGQLSEELGVEKIKLTQAFNLYLNRNFYSLVNEMRVQYAKQLLETTGELNMTVIGIESGFKNKSTFYKYFKEHYQVSPGDYKKASRNHNN
jgi:AraC-like DNA-binding protein